MVEWFQLIMCKEHTLARSTKLNRNHHILCFCLRREGRQMPILINFKTRSTEAAVRRWSSKQGFLKVLQYSQESTCAGVFLIKLQARRPTDLSKRNPNTVFFPVIYCEIFKDNFLQNASGSNWSEPYNEFLNNYSFNLRKCLFRIFQDNHFRKKTTDAFS